MTNDFSLGGAFFVLLYYLPIYFQAVLGVSAEQSGIRNLALIVAESKLNPSYTHHTIPVHSHLQHYLLSFRAYLSPPSDSLLPL
jgi:hypothetical protein